MRNHLAEGLAAHRAGRLREARASYGRALKSDPANPNLFHLLGAIDLAEGALDAGERRIRRALQLHPEFPDARYNLARVLHRRGRLAEAAAGYRAALALNPAMPEALRHLGEVLMALGDLAAAETSLRAAIAAAPGAADGHFQLGLLLQQLRRVPEAAACFRDAAAADPARPEPLYALAACCTELKQSAATIAALEGVVARDPEHAAGAARRQLMHLRLHVCDWRSHDADCAALRADALAGARVLPFQLRAAGADAAEMLAAAHAVAAVIGTPPAPPRVPHGGTRLRVGYLSSDLHNHPVGILAAELFERHDRDGFEIFAYSHSRPDPGPLRRRLEAAFDRFTDIRADGDEAAARRIAADGIDLLVDLNGYSGAPRPGILARRPAPVQANMLGCLAPMALPGVDFVIADPFVLPAQMQPFYPERILHVPHCYLPLDTRGRAIAAARSRAEYGLPEDGFVFANFSTSYKIAPAIFAVWMRLLLGVPGSVLWLYESGPEARANLTQAARAAGVAADRLVFGAMLPQPDYLARFTAADLFLDTLPCSACTTAIDALWAGLPILTCAGDIFAGRHAGSALRAAGLAELVTGSMAEYEALALRLARAPATLAGLRARLARREAPLFDMVGYTRALEDIYRRIAKQEG